MNLFTPLFLFVIGIHTIDAWGMKNAQNTRIILINQPYNKNDIYSKRLNLKDQERFRIIIESIKNFNIQSIQTIDQRNDELNNDIIKIFPLLINGCSDTHYAELKKTLTIKWHEDYWIKNRFFEKNLTERQAPLKILQLLLNYYEEDLARSPNVSFENVRKCIWPGLHSSFLQTAALLPMTASRYAGHFFGNRVIEFMMRDETTKQAFASREGLQMLHEFVVQEVTRLSAEQHLMTPEQIEKLNVMKK